MVREKFLFPLFILPTFTDPSVESEKLKFRYDEKLDYTKTKFQEVKTRFEAMPGGNELAQPLADLEEGVNSLTGLAEARFNNLQQQINGIKLDNDNKLGMIFAALEEQKRKEQEQEEVLLYRQLAVAYENEWLERFFKKTTIPRRKWPRIWDVSYATFNDGNVFKNNDARNEFAKFLNEVNKEASVAVIFDALHEMRQDGNDSAHLLKERGKYNFEQLKNIILRRASPQYKDAQLFILKKLADHKPNQNPLA